jgi:anti-sigma factor RsiW
MIQGGSHKHGPECKEVFALLSQYLDRELPEADCAEIEQHMADCGPCVQFLESLRRTIELCHHHGPDAKPGPLDAKLKHQLFETWQKMLAARQGR